MTEAEAIETRRSELMQAAVQHVAFDGWSGQALIAGARDLGLSLAEAHNLFPGSARELLEAFSAEMDGRMLDAMERQPLEEMRVREKVALGVRSRLELLEPYREEVQRGLSFLALPPNVPLGSRLVWRTCDAIWYAAGDTATDYNYYTKRSLLAGVYSSTLLYWLSDRSEGYEATWDFLDRRLTNVLKIGGTLGKSIQRLMDAPTSFFARSRGFGPRV
ncbi:COQ9 family protein [Algihabitans albus]|uniref:COQ9 family protein n=1 Tax=Algihabitans albus TaxID=2164067 RepID=UPI000E5C63C4|nr:COQ9 family protein [Algihabitans albus]